MAARKQNKGGGSSIMTLGLLAVGGYFVYEWFFATPATAATSATTAPATTTPTTSATTAPATTTGAGAPSSSPASSSPAAPSGSQLDSIYAALKAAAQPDTQFTGSGDSLTGLPFHFIFYLQRVYSGTIPDESTLGLDPNTPVTASQFWAAMGPQLKAANAGLSGGLGFYAGAGAAMRGMGYFAW